MADEHVKVTKTGWGQSIGKSIVGAVLGIVLFLVSFIVLWNSEGRTDLGSVAESSIIVEANTSKTSADGKLVSITGTLEAPKKIGDPKFLKADRYILLERKVEMYAWIEETESESKKKTGGTTETKTTYRYIKGWTSNPTATEEFEYPEEHNNPKMSIPPETFYCTEAKIGIYSFDPQSASLPSARPISLTNQNSILDFNTRRIGNEYIYKGKGSYNNPRVGDLRISFTAIKAGKKVTIFGKMLGKDIVAYYHKGKDRLYRIFAGTRDEAIVQLKTEHKVMGWILRIIGFILMWVGLMLVYGPISSIFDVLPFLGKISRGFFGIISFITALTLSIITILVSMIFHNTIALIIFIIIVIVLIYLVFIRKKHKGE